MSLVTIGGNAATRCRVTVADWGLWWLDVDLQEPETLRGRVTCQVADKTLQGCVVSGGAYEGRAAYRIVGGAGGWGSDIAKQGYANPTLGVQMATVVKAAASACGETVEGFPTSSVGPHFARVAGPASRVLNAVAPRGWHMGFDGVTRYGLRATTAYTGTDPLTRVVPDGSIVELSPEEIGQLVPGVTVNGSRPASDVEYLIDSKRLTVRLYAGTRRSRRMAAYARIVEALFPDLRYRGSYEYRVVQQIGYRFDLQPVRSVTGMPDLQSVPVRPGMAGLKANVQLGELVLVTFADNDPTRPQIVAHDAPDAPGYMPLFLDLGDGPTLGVARMTDPVVAGPFGGTIVGASVRVRSGL